MLKAAATLTSFKLGSSSATIRSRRLLEILLLPDEAVQRDGTPHAVPRTPAGAVAAIEPSAPAATAAAAVAAAAAADGLETLQPPETTTSTNSVIKSTGAAVPSPPASATPPTPTAAAGGGSVPGAAITIPTSSRGRTAASAPRVLRGRAELVVCAAGYPSALKPVIHATPVLQGRAALIAAAAAAAARPPVRGLNSSTSQLNLSRVCHKTTPYAP